MAVVLIGFSAVAVLAVALIWRGGGDHERIEITEAEALDRLSPGFEWEYDQAIRLSREGG